MEQNYSFANIVKFISLSVDNLLFYIQTCIKQIWSTWWLSWYFLVCSVILHIPELEEVVVMMGSQLLKFVAVCGIMSHASAQSTIKEDGKNNENVIIDLMDKMDSMGQLLQQVSLCLQ